jgi:hypothetical protein
MRTLTFCKRIISERQVYNQILPKTGHTVGKQKVYS